MTTSKDQDIQMKYDEANKPFASNGNTSTGLVISTESFLTINKDTLRDKAMSVVDNYLDGFKSPTEGLILAKKMIDMGEMIKENLAAAAASELRLAKSEKRAVHGNDITEQMVGVRYSYKDCNDPIWNELNEKIKQREAFLKTIVGSKQELIEETGEVVQIFEPTKSGKLSLIIKY